MKKTISFLMLMTSVVLFAQKDPTMALGNRDYSEKKFADAEARYRQAASKSEDGKAALNMGNAIYRENNATEAGSAYMKALQKAKSRTEKHRAYHNLGNVLMKAKDYEGAVDAYQNALRNNPSDEETRYNYALAKQLLKDNPPPKDKNKDKDKDKQKQQQQQDQKDQQQKDDPNKDGDKKPDPKDPNPQGQPKPKGGMSEQRMKGLLEAVNNEERKVQEKLKGKKAEGRPVENGKDW